MIAAACPKVGITVRLRFASAQAITTLDGQRRLSGSVRYQADTIQDG